MNQDSDQQMWFEVWGFDGFAWQFIADFDTRSDASRFIYSPTSAATDYDSVRIRRQFGQS